MMSFAKLSFQLRAEPLPQSRKESSKSVWQQHARKDVSRSACHRRQAICVILDLDDIAVLLAQRSIAQKGGQTQIQELCKD